MGCTCGRIQSRTTANEHFVDASTIHVDNLEPPSGDVGDIAGGRHAPLFRAKPGRPPCGKGDGRGKAWPSISSRPSKRKAPLTRYDPSARFVAMGSSPSAPSAEEVPQIAARASAGVTMPPQTPYSSTTSPKPLPASFRRSSAARAPRVSGSRDRLLNQLADRSLVAVQPILQHVTYAEHAHHVVGTAVASQQSRALGESVPR